MNRKELLEKAIQTVCQDRKDAYGDLEDNFELIGRLWTEYIDFAYKINPRDVAAMMILMKIARIATGSGKKDNWIDIAGYAACGGEIEAYNKIIPNQEKENIND